jgi:cytochrome c peroxidase
MRSARALWLSALGALCVNAACSGAVDENETKTESLETASAALSSALEIQLGGLIFNDAKLSNPAGQSCATCHSAVTPFVDPDFAFPTSEGVVLGRFGARNTPTAMYAQYVPPLHVDAESGNFVGGLFLDGRVNTLEEQAAGPFLNPLEMNNANKTAVVTKLRLATYATLFKTVYGSTSLNNTDTAYANMTKAIAAFERTATFRPFSSKYDAYLAGRVRLTSLEAQGLALYENPAKGNCAACHPSRPDAGSPPLFTDFTYDNLGVPKNPLNRFYTQSSQFNPAGLGFIDRGLGGFLGDAAEDGKFRVPTLRNIAGTPPYMHNGVFTSLAQVVDFYNTRDVKTWPAPEVASTVNHDELGHLGLTTAEAAAIVAFLGTLSDGYAL